MSSDFTPSPCRSIFSGGEWQVPPEDRPADWEKRTTARHSATTKAPYVCVRGEGGSVRKPRGFRVGHPKYGGKKAGAHKRVTITGPEIVARLEAGETTYTLAAKLKCDASMLYRIVQKAGLEIPPRKCLRCKEPTGKRHQAKYCATCVTARWRYWTDEALERLKQGAKKCKTCGVAPGLHALGDCSKCYQRNRKAAA